MHGLTVRQHAHAELTLEVAKYTLSEEGPVYVFISNDGKVLASTTELNITAQIEVHTGYVSVPPEQLSLNTSRYV